ncbi:MAG: hypothetical protein FWD35_03120 [Oscillospiraceae bacterium]|nr:hypothetical protein [Oscillospiraceae bacterium]
MALETKVILTATADNIAKSKTLKEAYVCVQNMANVEGVALPSYEDKLTEIRELRGEA